MSTSQNPELQPTPPHDMNDPVQPTAPDFIETPDVPSAPATESTAIPVWVYVACGIALFLAGSSFTGFHPGLYDSGPGAAIIASTGPAVAAAPLDPLALGKQIYSGNCANCHQATGEGQPGSYPPLAGSEWVLGDKTDLYAIMLHGLQGPLTVKGGAYGSMQMPGWSTALSDEKIADVMTYIRASWGNTGDAVKPDDVSAARAKFASHNDAYTEADLEKLTPGVK
jgi:mono/diheme cytochrome c family protein